MLTLERSVPHAFRDADAVALITTLLKRLVQGQGVQQHCVIERCHKRADRLVAKWKIELFSSQPFNLNNIYYVISPLVDVMLIGELNLLKTQSYAWFPSGTTSILDSKW